MPLFIQNSQHVVVRSLRIASPPFRTIESRSYSIIHSKREYNSRFRSRGFSASAQLGLGDGLRGTKQGCTRYSGRTLSSACVEGQIYSQSTRSIGLGLSGLVRTRQFNRKGTARCVRRRSTLIDTPCQLTPGASPTAEDEASERSLEADAVGEQAAPDWSLQNPINSPILTKYYSPEGNSSEAVESTSVGELQKISTRKTAEKSIQNETLPVRDAAHTTGTRPVSPEVVIRFLGSKKKPQGAISRTVRPQLPSIKSNREEFTDLVTGREYALPLSEQQQIALTRSHNKHLHGAILSQQVAKMPSYMQVVTTPTADTPGTTLILVFDNKRYFLGNCAEGTQRACIQQKVALIKLRGIFLTGSVTWERTGGVLGVMLTVADAISSSKMHAEAENNKIKKKKQRNVSDVKIDNSLTLHGGRNLMHLTATARRFVFRKGMPVIVEEVLEDEQSTTESSIPPTWQDDNIQVWSMAVSPALSPPERTARKRSHEEITNDESLPSSAIATTETAVKGRKRSPSAISKQEAVDDQLRRDVLAHMFNSDWRPDALEKIMLADAPSGAAVFVRNAEGHIVKYDGILPGGDEIVPDLEVLVRTPWPGANVQSLPATKPSHSSVSYIVKNYEQRGKFDPKVAMALGVQPGKDFGKLTQGLQITTEEGKVVTPEMVMSPSRPGHGMAIIELPDESYVLPTLARREWKNSEIMDGIGAITWILGHGVSKNQDLQDFMKLHKVSHFVSSPELSPNVLSQKSAAEAAARLNLVDPERFRIPHYASTPTSDEALPEGARVLQAGMRFQIEPRFEFSDTNILTPLDIPEIASTMPEGVVSLAQEAHKTISDPAYLRDLAEEQSDIKRQDVEITTLGTGSALPSKYRNVSATLVRIPGVGNYLFDCGENTLGQLKRVFGEELPEILQELKVIWISHLHADHHLGTASVIRAWHEETSREPALSHRNLMVASESGMLSWLKEYSSVEDIGYSRLVPVGFSNHNRLQKVFSPNEIKLYGVNSISACWVNHCHGAMAVAFSFGNFKVAYSGDCRPSDHFVRIGKNATVLIHEATFDDELRGDALAKKHSTTSEALQIGRDMKARRILLTHFSQRYQKIPQIEYEVEAEDGSGKKRQVVVTAFDYMRVKVGDMAKLKEFVPALTKLYEEKEDAKARKPIDEHDELD